MFTAKASTTRVGVVKIKNNVDKIIKLVKKNDVVIKKRRTPVLVAMSMKKYKKPQELIEELEDRKLGNIAKKRIRKTKLYKYIELGVAEKRVGLKK